MPEEGLELPTRGFFDAGDPLVVDGQAKQDLVISAAGNRSATCLSGSQAGTFGAGDDMELIVAAPSRPMG